MHFHISFARCHIDLFTYCEYYVHLWPPYVIGQAIYIFILWFLLLFSSPNLSGRRLDVYHTSTHGVALVRWKYSTQKIAKKSPSGHNPTTLSGYIFATKAYVDNRKKKLVKQQYLLHMSSWYGELRPTNGWDPLESLGHPSKFQRVSRLGSVTARHSSIGHQPNFAALSRGRHLFGRAAITLGIGPHSSYGRPME